MAIADPRSYCSGLVNDLKKLWPDNHTINIVCHGHSVPAGYFASGVVDTFNAYPHLFHKGLKERFPLAVINVIVTAIGGEASSEGAKRFDKDVLSHQPSLVTIDYALNDRRLGLKEAEKSWRLMIESAMQNDVKLILMTPTADQSQISGTPELWTQLQEQAAQIRRLASYYEVGLVDSLAVYERYVESGGELTDLLSWPNHPNRKGHDLVALELLRWFPITYDIFK